MFYFFEVIEVKEVIAHYVRLAVKAKCLDIFTVAAFRFTSQK